jgi:hypothetical protein
MFRGVNVSGPDLASSQSRVWVFTLIFPFYKMLFMNMLEFFVPGFFVRILKPEKSMVFGFL